MLVRQALVVRRDIRDERYIVFARELRDFFEPFKIKIVFVLSYFLYGKLALRNRVSQIRVTAAFFGSISFRILRCV